MGAGPPRAGRSVPIRCLHSCVGWFRICERLAGKPCWTGETRRRGRRSSAFSACRRKMGGRRRRRNGESQRSKSIVEHDQSHGNPQSSFASLHRSGNCICSVAGRTVLRTVGAGIIVRSGTRVGIDPNRRANGTNEKLRSMCFRPDCSRSALHTRVTCVTVIQ